MAIGVLLLEPLARTVARAARAGARVRLATAEATGKQLMAQAQSKVSEVLKGNKPSAAAKKAI